LVALDFKADADALVFLDGGIDQTLK